MIKTVVYTYLGTNGVISSPIYLPDTYSIKEYKLIADENKRLTKDNETFYQAVKVSEDDIDNWYEVDP